MATGRGHARDRGWRSAGGCYCPVEFKQTSEQEPYRGLDPVLLVPEHTTHVGNAASCRDEEVPIRGFPRGFPAIVKAARIANAATTGRCQRTDWIEERLR
jgi:hypothetical protein